MTDTQTQTPTELKEYALISDIDGKLTTMTLAKDDVEAHEKFMNLLGFSLRVNDADNGNQEYSIVNNDTKEVEKVFLDYLYENALLEAMTIMGHTVYPADVYVEPSEEEFDDLDGKLVPFELWAVGMGAYNWDCQLSFGSPH